MVVLNRLCEVEESPMKRKYGNAGRWFLNEIERSTEKENEH